MDGKSNDVLSGIKQGIDIEFIQEHLGLDDQTMFQILVELVRLDKIKVVVA
jgi:hypothetical protein